MTKSMFYGSKSLRLLAALLAAALFVLAACAQPNLPMLAQQAAAEDGGGGGGASLPEATALVNDTWANGNIAVGGGEQWFTFTAGATHQYFHFQLSTLNNLYVRVYDSSRATSIGGETNIYSGGSTTYHYLTGLTNGETYSVKVSPESGDSGTYNIKFNAQPSPDPIPTPTPIATADTWTSGNITTPGGSEWFAFEASASNQYIHFRNSTLDDYLLVRVYSESWQEVEDTTYIYGGTTYKRLTSLIPGQNYHIKIWAYDSGDTGTYDIKYNASSLAEPPVSPVGLTDDMWNNTDGDIATAGEVDWFTFVADVADQYIHIKHDGLTDLNVQVYDNGWQPVQGQTNIYDTTTYKRLTGLTSGQKYYIRVWPWSGSSSGTYKIGVTGTTTPPVTP